MKPCRHKYKTIIVDKKVKNHPRFGPSREEHRKCSLCGDEIVSYLLVSQDGSNLLSDFFSLKVV